MTVRPYLIEPPELPVIPDRKGNDQGFSYSLPAFMYRRGTQNPLTQYLKDVVAWADREYEAARLFYATAGNVGKLAWLQGISPEHVLGRSELVIAIFDCFDKQIGVWDSLGKGSYEQGFFYRAWQIYNFEKMSYEGCRQELRRKRVKPTATKLDRYDEALAALDAFNRSHPGPLSTQQRTDAAIAAQV